MGVVPAARRTVESHARTRPGPLHDVTSADPRGNSVLTHRRVRRADASREGGSVLAELEPGAVVEAPLTRSQSFGAHECPDTERVRGKERFEMLLSLI